MQSRSGKCRSGPPNCRPRVAKLPPLPLRLGNRISVIRCQSTRRRPSRSGPVRSETGGRRASKEGSYPLFSKIMVPVDLEHLDHLHCALGVAAGDAEGAVRMGMAATIYHCGLQPWAIYAVVALALALFAYNKGLPLTIRSAFTRFLANASGAGPAISSTRWRCLPHCLG